MNANLALFIHFAVENTFYIFLMHDSGQTNEIYVFE